MAQKPKKPVNLALQGGGAHGAFTWGVLDYILECGRLEIAGISGTSAGAMNAVAVADGFTRAGPDGAREALYGFWRSMSESARTSPLRRTPIDMFMGNWGLENNPAYHAVDALSRVASPYQFNPMNINPLRDLVEGSIDFAMVRACTAFEVFVSATNVETGRVKVFPREGLTADMVMASACLPHLYQAVEIDGVPYWDGGYMGNPVLSPFFTCCNSQDILIVQVNPIERCETPRTAREIQDRVNEISFNAPLVRELRHVEFINTCLQRGELEGLGYREIFVHRVGGGAELHAFNASSKMNAEWAFLKHLRDIGRRAGQRWIEENFECLGVRSTIATKSLAPIS